MKPKVAPKSITPSIPTFRTPERWLMSSPRAAKVKIVEASRLLAINSHIYLFSLGRIYKLGDPREKGESSAGRVGAKRRIEAKRVVL